LRNLGQSWAGRTRGRSSLRWAARPRSCRGFYPLSRIVGVCSELLQRERGIERGLGGGSGWHMTMGRRNGSLSPRVSAFDIGHVGFLILIRTRNEKMRLHHQHKVYARVGSIANNFGPHYTMIPEISYDVRNFRSFHASLFLRSQSHPF
jgi:hypothetical protein